MAWTIYEGHVLDSLRRLPDEHFQCVVTSPPYWGLRDYGTASWEGGDASCEHKGTPKPRQDTSGLPDKRFAETRGSQPGKCQYARHVRDVCRCGARRIDDQIGLEPTPELYVERLVEVFAEVRRVLRPDGTLWLNIGDCYASGSGAKQRGAPPSERSTIRGNGHSGGGPKLHAGATIEAKLASGLKPKDLVGIPWLLAFALRADGWWLRDEIIWHKPNPMPESVNDRTTKAHERVFLLTKSERYFYDADAIAEEATHAGRVLDYTTSQKANTADPTLQRTLPKGRMITVAEKRNARSVWTIATQPYAEAHFATFPQELPRRCIMAGTRPGDVVLDPFGGAGTTALVAGLLGRDAVLCELNPEYAAMARRRLERESAPLFNREQTVAVETA